MIDEIGKQMYMLCSRLFPICRSITGEGFRQSLDILREYLPELQIHHVPSGTKVFDWEVPLEWNIRDAYIIDPDGNKLCDFKENNLHIVGYSVPVDLDLSLAELQPHLYSLPNQPTAIPYITSYYRARWGFCLPHELREKLKEGTYHVFIDSDLAPGNLSYGELILPGEQREEIFFSTYLCHPSMANNELSGPVLATFLARWLKTIDARRFSYRIIIIPETIGSITYLSKNLAVMKQNIIAGFNLTCVGDEMDYSYLSSRFGDTLADKVALHVLKHTHPEFKPYTFMDRGSDERQYCSPGVDLPVCSMMRSKYHEYPEYHTSLDDLSFISPAGLSGSFAIYQKAIQCLEANEKLKGTVLCEPQLGKRGLYPTISTKDTAKLVKNMMNILAYADGTRTSLELAELIGVPLWEILPTINTLIREGLLEVID